MKRIGVLLLIAAFCVMFLVLLEDLVSSHQRRLILKSLGNASNPASLPSTFSQLLTLKPVNVGDDQGIADVELPIKYDSLKYNRGLLYLYVDALPEEEFYPRFGAYQECDKASNGDCLLAWNTTFDPTGVHNVQAALSVNGPNGELKFFGPKLVFTSNNVCQFYGFTFDNRGVPLYAKVFEPNAVYRIDLQTTNGRHLASISGKTQNGIIDQSWDFRDERGKLVPGLDELVAVFHITNSASGSLKLELSRIP